MSYARSVKKEVATLQATLEEDKALLYGYIKLKGELSLASTGRGFAPSALELSTSSLSITRKIKSILSRLYEGEFEIKSVVHNKLNHQTMYTICVKDNLTQILKDMDLSADGYYISDEVSTNYADYTDKVIAGMFLAKGSINDPEKTARYHLEIVCSNEFESTYVIDSLAEYGIDSNLIERKKGYVVYIKRSEAIGDFLKLIGANNEMFKFEDARIKRDYNNTVNRMYNCDMANEARTQEATNRQLAAIKKIEETIGYNALTPRLLGAVLLRTDYPYYTLEDLSEVTEDESKYFGKPLSKSGISHCLREIEEIASKL